MRESTLKKPVRTNVNVESVSTAKHYWKNGNLDLHHEEGRMEHVLSYTIYDIHIQKFKIMLDITSQLLLYM